MFEYVGRAVCKKVEYVNIREHEGTDVKVRVFQELNEYTLHIDTPSGSNNCHFNPKSGAVSSEDNFGWYGNGKFRCTATDESTTQYWFGAKRYSAVRQTALQCVTELDHGPSHWIFKKHWFIDNAIVVFHR